MVINISILFTADAQGQCWFQEHRIFGKGGKIPKDVHEKFCYQSFWVRTLYQSIQRNCLFMPLHPPLEL